MDDAVNQKSALSNRARLLLLSAGLMFALLLVLLLEVVVRVGDLDGPYRYQDPFLGFDGGSPLFVADGEAGVFRTDEAKLMYFNQQSFSMEKPANGYRVFALGGSTTNGRPYDHRVSFARWLEDLLQAAQTGKEVEVINAGGVSYASYRVVLLMQELVNYQPDLFIVYSGHNEFLEERTYGDLKDNSFLERGVSRLRLTTWLRGVAGKGSRGPGDGALGDDIQARLDVWSGMDAYQRDDNLRGNVLGHYGFNLRRMVRIAKDHGIPIVFVDPVANIRDFSPFKSQKDTGLSDADAQRFDTLLAQAEGTEDLEARQNLLEEAVGLSPRHAGAHFQLAQTLEQSGSAEAAKRHYLTALTEDVCPLRITPDMNEILAAVSAETQTPLIPFRETLLERSTHLGLPGNDHFLDHVHPTIEAHQFLAELLTAYLMDSKVLAGEADVLDRAQAVYQAGMAALDAGYNAQRDLNLAKVLGWAGKHREALTALERSAEPLARDPRFHYNRGVLLERLKRPAEAATAYRACLGLDPTVFEAHFNLGKTQQALARHPQAVAAFNEALVLKPDSSEVRYNLAQSQLRVGEPAAALQLFEALEAEGAPYPRLTQHRADALVALGRHDEAMALFDQLAQNPDAGEEIALARALALSRRDPGEGLRALEPFLENNNAAAWQAAARLRDQLGDPSGAGEAFARVVALSPEDADAHHDLGVHHHRAGRLAQAIKAYGDAVALDPQHLGALEKLAAALGAGGDLAGARENFERVVQLDPQNGGAWYNLAQLAMAQRDPNQAARYLQRAEDLGARVDPKFREMLRGYPR